MKSTNRRLCAVLVVGATASATLGFAAPVQAETPVEVEMLGWANHTSETAASVSEFRADLKVTMEESDSIKWLKYQWNLADLSGPNSYRPLRHVDSIQNDIGEAYGIIKTVHHHGKKSLYISARGDLGATLETETLRPKIEVATNSGRYLEPEFPMQVTSTSGPVEGRHPVVVTPWDNVLSSQPGHAGPNSEANWGNYVSPESTTPLEGGRFYLDALTSRRSAADGCDVTDRMTYQWVNVHNKPVTEQRTKDLVNHAAGFTNSFLPGTVSFEKPGYYKLMAWANARSSYRGDSSCADVGMNPENIAEAAQVGSVFWKIADQKLTASVERSDLAGRSAVLVGKGLPGNEITAGQENRVRVSDSGDWTLTVHGLRLGENAVPVTQFDGDDETDALTIGVNLNYTELSAVGKFDKAAGKPYSISGEAQPGSRITVIRDAPNDSAGMPKTLGAKNDVVASTETGADGSYSVGVPAPNAGGIQSYRVEQRIDGELASHSVSLDADYGSAVSITSPVNDAVHAGGALTFKGRAVAGAEIVLREQGKQGILGTTTALTSGQWTIPDAVIPGAKKTYQVTSTGRGQNVTVAVVSLNPDADYQEVTLTSPKSGSEFEPNSVVRFTGTGTPGGVITLAPTNGAASTTTTVNDDGEWSIDRFLGNGSYTFNVTQVANGTTSSVDGISLTPKSAAPVDQDFAVTTPKDGASAANKAVTFTGTGAAGTTVRIHTTNFASADITTAVKNDGTWSVNKWIGNGPYVMDITQEGRVSGAVRGFTINNEVAVNNPFAVTSPTAGDDVRGKVATFTGTGRHGETVTIKVTSPAGLAEVTGVVKKDGTWSINRYIGDGPYAFDIIQTKNGIETGSVRDFRINQPAKIEGDGIAAPFVVTAPTDGDTFTANTQIAFTGTATTGALITITPNTGAPVTTTALGDGTWAVKKFLGDGPYTFTITATTNGETETHPHTITLTPTP